MKIFVITPIYATTTEGDGATPLVHYFAREWVKMGHEVVVFNFQSKFPIVYYIIGKLFQHQINSRLGMLIPTRCPVNSVSIADGVIVHKRTVKKIKPHTEFSNKNIQFIIDEINEEVKNNGIPDYFIGHWDSPCLEVLPILKHIYSRPISVVFHTNNFNLEKRFGDSIVDKLKEFDVLGFRSKVAQVDFENKYFKPKRSFICYSGVSDLFINEGVHNKKRFKGKISSFIYVGSMISRKYPDVIYESLCCVYPDGNFSIKYIGDGAEISTTKSKYSNSNLGNVEFLGRIPRESIISHLKDADVFVMISKDEIFGLVYLEAMALGVIPIGSRNEGIDGIIIDGYNGFLCEAGNKDELSSIIERLYNMPPNEIKEISDNAKKTAVEYSDFNVASKYINSIV